MPGRCPCLCFLWSDLRECLLDVFRLVQWKSLQLVCVALLFSNTFWYEVIVKLSQQNKKFFVLQLIADNYVEKLVFTRYKMAGLAVWGIKVQTVWDEADGGLCSCRVCLETQAHAGGNKPKSTVETH